MGTTTLILVVLGLAAWVATVLVLVRVTGQLARLQRKDPESGLLLLQEQVDALREQLRVTLEGGRLEIDQRLAETNRVVGEVRRGLGEVDQQVRSVGNVARDLRGLQELLRSPKLRGGIGELLLGELLSQVLPHANFELQYAFAGGERVDAVLRVGDRLVPIDAKFPLENFRRAREAQASGDVAGEQTARRTFRGDVKRHIDAIARRYIRPAEGTYEFALMYVPAEGVYQALLEDDCDDLMQFALTRRIVPVSPHSFYAYLQVIVLGLRGLHIESRASEIMDRLASVRTRLDQFNESFDVVIRHLGNAQRQGDEAGRRMARLDAAFSDLERQPDADQEPDQPLPSLRR